jgi:hypothetical protein
MSISIAYSDILTMLVIKAALTRGLNAFQRIRIDSQKSVVDCYDI